MIKVKTRYQDNFAEFEFPCGEKELYAKLRDILKCNPQETTIYIAEVIYPQDFAPFKDRFINLDELNYLAKRMESFFGNEEPKFYEAMKLENFIEPKDLINLSFNLDKYALITDVSNMGKVGREYLLETVGCVPAHDEDDPKYAVLGREVLTSGNGIFTEYGLLFADRSRPFEELYNGQTFSAYLYDECLFVGTISHEDKEEYVYLPDDELAIDKAARRLSQSSLDNCEITLSGIYSDTDALFDLAKQMAETQGLYEVNRFAKEIFQNAKIQDIGKLSAVMEYAGSKDPQSAILLAENLDCFEFVKGVNGYAELGHHYLKTEDAVRLTSETEEFFDFEAYGKSIAENGSGQFLDDGCYVGLVEGYSIEDILESEENETMTMGGM